MSILTCALFAQVPAGFADCPYGNDEPAYPTCDFRLVLQENYSDYDLQPYGFRNDGWSINGHQLHAGNQPDCDNDWNEEMCVQRFINYTEDEVRTKFASYIRWKGFLTTTEHMVILDLEPNGTSLQGMYLWEGIYFDDNPNVDVRDRLIDAFKMRVRVGREFMPKAKLALYGTGLFSKHGKGTQADDLKLATYLYAGERGLYDQLDYIVPVMYVKYGPPDYPSMEAYLEYIELITRNGIERSQQLRKSDGSKIPMAALLSFQIENPSPYSGQLLDFKAAQTQIRVLGGYSSVAMVAYWSAISNGRPSYDQFPTFLKNVKPAPSFCFCEDGSRADEDEAKTRFIACMDPKNAAHRQNPPVCFQTAKPGKVKVAIYTPAGELVRTMVEGEYSTERQTVAWDRKNDNGEVVASGVYVLVMEANGEKKTGKVVVIK